MSRVPLIILALVACSTRAASETKTMLDQAFLQPSPQARPWVYWYWMNGNVTRDGIIADLKAMQEVGVGGVFLMDIGIHPAGPVRYRSRAWFDLVKVAVAEARKHNIAVSFHCPGWSASGGPWVTAEMAMQELTWSEAHVTGGRELSLRLAQPSTKLDFYRDIAVLAFPTLDADDWSLRRLKPRVLGQDGKPATSAEAAFDGDTNTAASLPESFELVFDAPVPARTICIRAAQANGSFKARLLAWEEGRTGFRHIAEIRSNTSGPFSAQVGATTFPAVRAARFRLEFEPRRPGDRVIIEELDLRGGYRDSGWIAKAAFATDPVAFSKQTEQPGPADVIPLERILDVTRNLGPDGRLTWLAPPGQWTILRLGHTPTGIKIAPAPAGGDGLECDKMSRQAADFHYDRFMKPILKDLGPELTQVVVGHHVDSYEAGWQNWTPSLPQEFRTRRGYEFTNYLPAVTGRVVADAETTEKFLWDFRRTIGDLFADNHYGRLAERSRQDGLSFSTEPYGGPFEFLQIGERANFPMVEFWLPTNPEGRKVAFGGVFSGRTAGRNVIGAEAFTSGPPEEKWDSHPYSLKAVGDFIWTCGVNRFVIHVSAHQPWIDEHLRPGLTCGINGIHFDRGNTWFAQSRAWVDYLTRSQALLQQGMHVADVLYFQGDDSPDGVGPFQPELPEGYDFDACGGEALGRLRVEDGRLVLPDSKDYRYLVLPGPGRTTSRSLERVAVLLRDGATVIGRPPGDSPSLADTAAKKQREALTAELWGLAPPDTGLRRVGKGRLIWGETFAKILSADRLPPDFAYDEGGGMVLHAIHRKIDDSDIYFVANASPRAGWVDCRFRVLGKVPELWRADSGSRTQAACFATQDAITRLPLYFDRAGSVFVVFRPGSRGVQATDFRGVAEAARGASALRIRKASYGPPSDPTRTVDVTARLQLQVKDGRVRFQAFTSLAGDPAPGVRKQLRVEYEADGRPQTVAAWDGQTLLLPEPAESLDAELLVHGGKLALRAWRAGRFSVGINGRESSSIAVPAIPPPLELTGPWELSFPRHSTFPRPLLLPKLLSWPDHHDPEVRYFSGTATYRKKFDIPQDRLGPGRSLHLDLGDVQVIAEATLNGKEMGVLWKPPFRLDITDVARQGANDLEIRVTNLWPNRLIGDEQYDDDSTPASTWTCGGITAWPDWVLKGESRRQPRRQTFAAFKHWKKDDSLLPSGLLGPVLLYSALTVPVHAE